MKKLFVLLTIILTLGFVTIGQADLIPNQIGTILNDGSLIYMRKAQVRFYDARYLQIEQHIPATREALTAIFSKDLTTKHIPELFDCDDVANVAQATIIETMANILWAENVQSAVPVATVTLHDIRTGYGVHMINLLIFENKAILYDFTTDSVWNKDRLILNGLAIGIIQF